jgi:hypothetical protein
MVHVTDPQTTHFLHTHADDSTVGPTELGFAAPHANRARLRTVFLALRSREVVRVIARCHMQHRRTHLGLAVVLGALVARDHDFGVLESSGVTGEKKSWPVCVFFSEAHYRPPTQVFKAQHIEQLVVKTAFVRATVRLSVSFSQVCCISMAGETLRLCKTRPRPFNMRFF